MALFIWMRKPRLTWTSPLSSDPGHAEHDHALGLDDALEDLGVAVLGMPVEDERRATRRPPGRPDGTRARPGSWPSRWPSLVHEFAHVVPSTVGIWVNDGAGAPRDACVPRLGDQVVVSTSPRAPKARGRAEYRGGLYVLGDPRGGRHPDKAHKLPAGAVATAANLCAKVAVWIGPNRSRRRGRRGHLAPPQPAPTRASRRRLRRRGQAMVPPRSPFSILSKPYRRVWPLVVPECTLSRLVHAVHCGGWSGETRC